MDDKKALYEKVADELLDQMRRGTLPIQMLWKKEFGRYFTCPYNPTRNDDFNGLNSVWLSLQQRNDPRWNRPRSLVSGNKEIAREELRAGIASLIIGGKLGH